MGMLIKSTRALSPELNQETYVNASHVVLLWQEEGTDKRMAQLSDGSLLELNTNLELKELVDLINGAQ
jgi:hypothetical protein